MSQAYVLMTAVGLAAFDENGGLISFKPFAAAPAETATVLTQMKDGEMPTQYVEEFLNNLRGKGVKTLFFWDEKVGKLLEKHAERMGARLELVEARPLDIEAALSDAELENYRKLVRDVAAELARQRVVAEAGRRDLHIVHAVRAFDDLERMKNQVFARVREWYEVHFPELASIVEDPDTYLKLVSTPFVRDKIDVEKVSKVLDANVLKRVSEAAEKSVGGGVGDRDMARIASLASLGLEISRLAEKTGEYIKELMAVEAPNLSAVAGPVLGSRLISLAGGLEKLARLPASTIQVLGAEKALFRFFKTGRGAPKHGVIFQHPFVHSAPRWQRGKIARVLAAKISIAARIDYFSKEDRSGQLRSLLEQRVEEIKKKYATPPKKEAEKPGRKRRVRR
ncbi:MAG: hypothetical protein QXK38_06295 [Candidatus Caldarchaeum sp.]